jgi:ferredoxin
MRLSQGRLTRMMIVLSVSSRRASAFPLTRTCRGSLWKLHSGAYGTTSILTLVRHASTNSPNDEGDTLPQHTITWETTSGVLEFEALDGELLRTAALRRGVVSPHNGRANLINCRGLGTCGTCAIELLQTSAHGLPPRNAVEDFRLAVPPGHGRASSARLRLACQATVHGDLHVVKRQGFWGQQEAMAAPSRPTRPFGGAEFFLDRTSPPDTNAEDEESSLRGRDQHL